MKYINGWDYLLNDKIIVDGSEFDVSNYGLYDSVGSMFLGPRIYKNANIQESTESEFTEFGEDLYFDYITLSDFEVLFNQSMNRTNKVFMNDEKVMLYGVDYMFEDGFVHIWKSFVPEDMESQIDDALVGTEYSFDNE